MKTSSNLERTTVPLFIIFALGCFAIPAIAQAVSPAPDGGYPGGNTAEGQNALLGLTSGGYNTAVGFFSLRTDTTGGFNTAIGAGALFANTAEQNTATGAAALLSNNTGTFNTANGAFALLSNTTASGNVAIGYAALASNTTAGIPNYGSVAVGYQALTNQNGEEAANNAVGQFALFNTTTGAYNNAFGSEALYTNVTGRSNTAIGDAAGYYITGTYNVCIGANVYGSPDENNTIRIGDNLPANAGQSACYVGGIFGQSVDPGSATTVYASSNGKLGISFSSQRFKRDIKPMDNASEAVLALKPVTFHYKSDAKNTPCFGLIAEDVAAVSADLVVRDKEEKPLTVRYEQINAMLLNEFLKEHKKVEEQGATIAGLKSTVAGLVTTVKEQTAEIQKVSAQLELGKHAPKTVLNNQ